MLATRARIVAACRLPLAQWGTNRRWASNAGRDHVRERNRRLAIYMASLAIAGVGLSYGAVPLYKVFCQATGYGGTVQENGAERLAQVRPVKGARQVRVYFEATTTDNLPWKFTPQQRYVKVIPGETALAFYTAKNVSERPIVGVSTYNVTPMKVGVYFNKIQCFCFEEQRLLGKEEVDMPVFFFIDPAFCDDPQMRDVDDIVLSYTFFKTREQEEEDEMLRAATVSAPPAAIGVTSRAVV